MKKLFIIITMLLLTVNSNGQSNELTLNTKNNTVDVSSLNHTVFKAVTNDTPCNAIALTNNNCRTASTISPLVQYTLVTATTDITGTASVPTPTCWSSGFSTTTWFSFVATSTTQKISTDVQFTGGFNDTQIAVYSSSNGACSGNFSLIGCQDDICNCTGPGNNQQAELTVTGLTAGQTYWVAVDGDGTKDGPFNICTQPSVTNDACSSALNMTSGTVYNSSNIGSSPYTNVGTGAYPSTNTGDVNFTCGSTENMVFYSFTAPTTGTYYLEQSAQVCAGSGSQVIVFKSTYNCSTLPENPMTAGSATYELICSSASTAYRYFTMSLTAGETYIIGVDGYAGDECSYQITIGPVLLLPIELLEFNGYSKGITNYIYWTTSTETINDYFTLEKSANGVDWGYLVRINGGGNTNEQLMYSYDDTKPFNGVTYYRLKQTDTNGDFKTFNTIAIRNERKPNYIVSLGDKVIYLTDEYDYQLYNTLGQLVDSGRSNIIRTSKFSSGIYIIKVGLFTQKVIIR